jgi:hypothetical protein
MAQNNERLSIFYFIPDANLDATGNLSIVLGARNLDAGHSGARGN